MKCELILNGDPHKVWCCQFKQNGKTVSVYTTSRKYCIEEAINYFFTGAYAYAGTMVLID